MVSCKARFYCGCNVVSAKHYREAIEKMVSGATFFEGVGFWMDTEEPTLVVEIIMFHESLRRAMESATMLAKAMARAGSQRCVLYTLEALTCTALIDQDGKECL